MAKFVDVVLRLAKGTPLSYVEGDANFQNLQLASAPIGAIFLYTSSTDLPGTWLECNGASLASATYSDLYSIIGNIYGGDATNFNIPDLRGRFPRGWDNGADVDSGRVFGSVQEDELKSHGHSAYYRNYQGEDGGSTRHYGWDTHNHGTRADHILNTGGDETRPKNIALMYLIKASIS